MSIERNTQAFVAGLMVGFQLGKRREITDEQAKSLVSTILERAPDGSVILPADVMNFIWVEACGIGEPPNPSAIALLRKYAPEVVDA